MLPRFEERMALIITATRIVVAKRLRKEHGMTQQQIARRLGIAQPAVNRYLKGSYSRKMVRMERLISRREAEREVMMMAVKGSPARKIAHALDLLSTDRGLTKEAAKNL